MSDFFRLVQQRESCRNYQPGHYPTREQLMHCVEAARLAPSACNSQPWSFIVANHEAAAKVAPCVQSGKSTALQRTALPSSSSSRSLLS